MLQPSGPMEMKSSPPSERNFFPKIQPFAYKSATDYNHVIHLPDGFSQAENLKFGKQSTLTSCTCRTVCKAIVLAGSFQVI